MKFKYKAQTNTGEIIEGVAEAEDKYALARMLRRDGDLPLYAEAAARKEDAFAARFNKTFAGKVKLQDKIVFTKNLAGMLTAGLALARALGIIEKQTKNIKFKEILNILINEVNKGSSLSEGMQKFPKVFASLFVSMVSAGEESGSLPQSLMQVGTNLEKTYALTRKIKGAMMYPIVILGAMALIGVLMFIFVVPTLLATFKELGGDLPASTKFIIFISDTISGHPFILLGIIVAIVVGLVYLSKLPAAQRAFDYMVIRLPAIGTIAKEVNAARTARTLSSLLDAGVDMTRCLTITKDVLQNAYYKKVIDEAIVSVQKGVTLSVTFKQHPELYPMMVGEMVEVGEETGKLGSMLADIALFYETEVDAKTKDLSTIVEPILMIFIGAAVGFFAFSIISPLYSIGSAIK